MSVRNRVVKVRVSDAELSAWQALAEESFEGNLSDAIRSAMSVRESRPQPVGGAAIFTSGISTGSLLEAGLLKSGLAVQLADELQAECPHGRVRGSQWCPRCDG